MPDVSVSGGRHELWEDIAMARRYTKCADTYGIPRLSRTYELLYLFPAATNAGKFTSFAV
jgi:hypothetical protein